MKMSIKEDIKTIIEDAEKSYLEAEKGVKIMKLAGEATTREEQALRDLKRRIDAYKNAVEKV
jgi:hypothetical protein